MTTLTKSELQTMPNRAVVVDADGDEWRKEAGEWTWNGMWATSTQLAKAGVKAC